MATTVIEAISPAHNRESISSAPQNRAPQNRRLLQRLQSPIFGLVALIAGSFALRIGKITQGFWVDEAISVGIADRPVTTIPATLLQDGAPPLYYMLLHFWIELFGSSEAATHSLSFVFALLAIPVAYWIGNSLVDSRVGLSAALLLAVNPFLTRYAQETRMYSLVVLLGLVACGAFIQTFVVEHQDRRQRRKWSAVFVVALAALLYTHNWAIFFTAGTLVALAVICRAKSSLKRRALIHRAALLYGVCLLLYLPWVPAFIAQALHTGAPWQRVPRFSALTETPELLLGEFSQILILFVGGLGVIRCLRRVPGAIQNPKRMVVLTLLIITAVGIVVPWLVSQLTVVWAARYLAVVLPVLILLCAVGFMALGRVGVIAVIAAGALALAAPTGEKEKSNASTIATELAPALRNGDLVVSTQPEQAPVLAYYLSRKASLRFASLTGQLTEPRITDWRDGLQKLEQTSVSKDLAPLLENLPVGGRIALVRPINFSYNPHLSKWHALVRARSEKWEQAIVNDPRFEPIAFYPQKVIESQPNSVKATVFVKK